MVRKAEVVVGAEIQHLPSLLHTNRSLLWRIQYAFVLVKTFPVQLLKLFGDFLIKQ